jgi:GNAT superfamily N-acetyltransferase
VEVKVRRFRNTDAPQLVEWLAQLAPAEDVYTAAQLVHWRRMLPVRSRPLWLVATIDGAPVGLGREEPQILGSRPGLRRTWIGVRPEFRRRGIGARLWTDIEAHAKAVGGRRLRSWSLGDAPEGERFLVARGFVRTHREIQSWVDPASLDRDDLNRRTAEATQRGFRVAALRELLPRMEPGLRRLFLAADIDAPGHGPESPQVAAQTFRRVFLANPILDQDCSTVVVLGDEPVALSWLKGDLSQAKYGVEFTGTLPAWRGRGLATLAKLTALALAGRRGIRWVGTANDETNAAMLAVNRRLGHQRLADLLIHERDA